MVRKRKGRTRAQIERDLTLRTSKAFTIAATLPATLQELEAALGKKPRALGAMLISRYNSRLKKIGVTPRLLPLRAWEMLATVPPADAALSGMKAGWPDTVMFGGGETWVGQLRWALDESVRVCWLMRSGDTVGALVSARVFLERWTTNVASTHSVEKAAGENDSDFISRVWSVYPPIASRHDLGKYWAWISELLHGRPADATAFGSSDVDQLSAVEFEQIEELHSRLAVVLEVATRQVRGAISSALTPELQHLTTSLQSHRPELSAHTEPTEIVNGLHQLDHVVVSSPQARAIEVKGNRYRALVGSSPVAARLAEYFLPDMSGLAMLERRARVMRTAREAFLAEARKEGTNHKPAYLAARLFRYIAIGEAGLLVGSELAGHQRDALVTASIALRSAWRLWLEDTDHAMACLRVVVEQTARFRTHRLKPIRAAKLEARGSDVSPNRWLESSGWNRLASFGRVLGEFSHLTVRSQRAGARSILNLLQGDDAVPETARGRALTEVSYMLAYEILQHLDSNFPNIANAFRVDVTLRDPEEHEAGLTAWLESGLATREADFRGSDWIAVDDAEVE